MGDQNAIGTSTGAAIRPPVGGPAPGAPAAPGGPGMARDSAPIPYKARLLRWQNQLATVIAQAKAAKPAKGAEPDHWAMIQDVYSEPWMFHNATTDPPRNCHGAADVRTRTVDGLPPAGSTPEGRLRAALMAANPPLEPAQVLKLSLEVNGDDYFLAMLAAHNVMKDVASTERRLEGSTPAGRLPVDPATAKADQALEARLVSLRPPGTTCGADKMGPWYHLFAIGTIDAATRWLPVLGWFSGGVDEAIIRVEHVPPHGCDREKEVTDEMMTAAIRQGDRMKPGKPSLARTLVTGLPTALARFASDLF